MVQLNETLKNSLIHEVLSYRLIEKIILFGSRARGTAKKTSDIDIAVVSDHSISGLQDYLEEKLKTLLKIDVIDYKKASPKIRKEIETEGIILYEKS